MIPHQWQNIIELLTIPLSWIPEMQRAMLGTLLGSSGWLAVVSYVLLLFPAVLWIAGAWCTTLSIYTLPFRSGRNDFVKATLFAWWDGAVSVWMFWVGLGRFLIVITGWFFTLARLAFRMIAEIFRQLIAFPFSVTGHMTQSYFTPGVPWIAFLMLLFWCVLEATIFTFTLFPTVSDVLASIVGGIIPGITRVVLFFFLLLLIMGSFACVQVLADSFRAREYKYLVQMILVEFFVMAFEVMFLYRELVDAITPWLAHQTGGRVQLGIAFTLGLATFGWVGIRGMTWFLFGQFGTPPLLAIISRRPMVHSANMPENAVPKPLPEGAEPWWRAPLQDVKHEITWLHEKGMELLEYLTLPFIHVLAAGLNFAMILVTGRPVFRIPFKNLQEVLHTRRRFPDLPIVHKKEPVYESGESQHV